MAQRQFARIKAAFCGACAYCGGPGPLTRDHVVPISKNGPLGFYNIVPACRSCNENKGSNHVVNYILTAGHDVERLTERWMRAIDYMAPRVEAAAQRGKLGKFSFADWSEMLWSIIIELENISPKKEEDT